MATQRETSKHTNRLIDEASPYLLQHAHNPVNWYPWDRAAFERARNEDKPVFLSIGYAACHWCHVMEHESFEDEATAAILNEHFIAVKVDREARPDIDELYMKAVQMMTGSGGWPLSVFLTPDGRPFYGGTYFAPRAGFGRPSFRQVLQAVAQAWRERRDDLLGPAEQIVAALQSLNVAGAPARLSGDIIHAAFAHLRAGFDETHGGFTDAPKFPQGGSLSLLLTYWHRTGDARALEMVTRTLDAMSCGGIHDHLGGGFHRYSTDAQWLLPHFEKMLYDQALLAKVYVQAYQATAREAYAAVARDVLDYVLRDMTDADGGFYAAEDADSEGREGAFYVWDHDEVVETLGRDAAGPFCDYYGVTAAGDFEAGKSILHVTSYPEPAGLEQARWRLLARRQARPRPQRDDKIITAWNGLMVSALACAGAALDDQRYVAAARRAAGFVLDRLRVGGRLMRYYRAGRVVEKAFLDDHACMIAGLLDLYEASFETRWLGEAVELAERMIELFAERRAGGFYLTGHDADAPLARDKPGHDGAIPSGNSVAALTLLKLGRLTATERFSSEGRRVLDAFSGAMSQSPTAFAVMLQALDYAAGPTQEIVIASSGQPSEAKALLRCVRRHFLPGAVLAFCADADGGNPPWLPQAAAGDRPYGPVNGHAAAYVCENYACHRPVTTTDELDRILAGIPRKD